MTTKAYKIGAPYFGVRPAPELAVYAWNPLYAVDRLGVGDGQVEGAMHRLTVSAPNVSARELTAFRAGPVAWEFALDLEDGVIVLGWRAPDAGWDWARAFYSWHLERKAWPEALVPDADVPEHLGVPIDLVLVEATRDQLAAIRRVALPGSFASQLQGAILEQQRMPFEVKTYDAKVAELDRRSRESIEQSAIARCTVGGARGR